MSQQFDVSKITKLDWRQGSVFTEDLKRQASGFAPTTICVTDQDMLVVMSHDCDINNVSLEKEPVVEILKASVIERNVTDAQQAWGRHPRHVEVVVELDTPTVLRFSIHDRWSIPRELLLDQRPAACLPDKERRVVAQWLAKRYIRAAFPTAFDNRWHGKMKQWLKLLRKHSEWVQGVYLRLNTLSELPADVPYLCAVMLAVPEGKNGGKEWPSKRVELENDIQAFWDRLKPKIECVDINVAGTDEITLSEIETYQRFDADWVSFDDDTPAVSVEVDIFH